MTNTNEHDKFYTLVHLGGPKGGRFDVEPKMKEQDAEAKPAEGYVVAFFPKLDVLGPATLEWPSVWETLSRTPKAAISKFMDRICKGEEWATYQEAGHCVRRVRLVDLGPADDEGC